VPEVRAGVRRRVRGGHASTVGEGEKQKEVYTGAMALSIKSDEADRLARRVAAATGESLTEAVLGALRERLERLEAARGPSLPDRMRRLQVEVRALPVLDRRPPEEVLGYDADGLPS